MCHVKFFLWEGLVNAIKKEWMPARYKLNVWKTRFKTLNKGKGFLFLFIRISLANLFILVITHSLFEGHYGPQGTAESRNSTDHKSSGKKYPIPGCEICHYLISMTILLSLCCRFLFCYPKISHWQPVSETQPSNGIMLIKKNPSNSYSFLPYHRERKFTPVAPETETQFSERSVYFRSLGHTVIFGISYKG